MNIEDPTVPRNLPPVARRDSAALRVAAMVLRYLYLIQGSWPRVLDLW